ncbi:hypothetical protein [Aureimonas endophytica]|uniref:hypothetical protein n=1 Tax=Aureimonas endophytica TaxID=2027858 RepID=UPI001AEE1D0F|nr:hypothetical protein [Aureimonas endophytica]
MLLGLIAARLAQGGIALLIVLAALVRRQWSRDEASTFPANVRTHGATESAVISVADSPHVVPRMDGSSTPRRPSYLPALSPDETRLAHSLAFVIRNRGGRHGPVAASHWRTLDAATLPLAVYLRDIDDRGLWPSLEREVSAYRLSGLRPVLAQDRTLGQERLVKLVQLAPRWKARGVALLAGDGGRDPDQPRLELVPGDDLDGNGGWRPT